VSVDKVSVDKVCLDKIPLPQIILAVQWENELFYFCVLSGLGITYSMGYLVKGYGF
jgi:hypothetical protein